MEELKLHVEGMACGYCEVAIQDAVRKLPGIQKVKANKRRKEAVVHYNASLVSPEQIVEAINGTGYQVIV